MSDFERKTDYLIETKGLLKDRINSLGGSITSGTTFRDYLVWLDSLYEALEEKTITGLPDSLEGKCEQTTTPGNNLFGNSIYNGQIGSNGGYTSSTTRITNATQTLDNTFFLKKGKYTLSIANLDYCTALTKDSNGTIIDNWASSWQSLPFTFTMTEDGYLYFTARKSNNSNLTPSDYNVMLNTGETALPYEPYTYGPTPNPHYPQPINITTGEQDIVVCEKNILDLSGFITHTNYGGLNISYSNGKLLIDGTATSNVDMYLLSTGWNTKGQELSNIINSQISYLTLSSTKSGLIYYFQMNGAYIQNTINRANPTDNITNMFVRIPNGTSFNNEEIGIQLERNSQPSTYEVYTGNTYEINLGKNIMNLNNITGTTTTVGVSFTKQVDGSILIDGTSTSANDTWVILSNINYTSLYGTPSINIGQVQQTVKSLTQGNFTLSASITNGTLKSFSYNSNNNATACLIGAGASFDNAVLTVQLEKGSLTDYTPYKTPIELCKIGTYQDRIFKTSGKNLFDKDTEDYEKGYYLDNNGVETSGTNWGVYYIPVKPNTAYSISGCLLNGGVSFCWFTSNKTFISRIGQKQDRDNMVSPNNAGYIGLSIVWNTSSSAYDGNTFMLNEGQTALPYEPYGNGEWYIHKEIGKVVLNGSEHWSYISVAQGILYRSDNAITNAKNDTTYAPICNYFRGIPLSQQGLRQDGDIYLNAGYNYTDVIDNTHTTSTIFKNFLASNNVEVYYVLNTPTNTLIEDEELINQLNEIEIFTVISEDFYN